MCLRIGIIIVGRNCRLYSTQDWEIIIMKEFFDKLLWSRILFSNFFTALLLKKIKKNYFTLMLNFLKNADQFSVKFSLLIGKNQQEFKSYFGAIMSIIIYSSGFAYTIF